jgi:predicted ATPase/DNA-binding SARP family transcriptional activator
MLKRVTPTRIMGNYWFYTCYESGSLTSSGTGRWRAMARLTLQLLGPLSATRGGDTPVTFAYDKVRALLAYLAMEHERVHPRSRLAAMLWPEAPESAARHSLSQALTSLRSSIGEPPDNRPILIADRQNIRYSPAPWSSVDVLDFTGLLRQSGDAEPTLEQLRSAVALYKGPFLDGLSLADCPEFEDWQRATRENIARNYSDALRLLVRKLEAAGSFADASVTADRLLELDPWDEENHRLKMRMLAADGNRAAAIRHFESCIATLRRDLDLEPESETRELARQIRSESDQTATGVPIRHDSTKPAPVDLPNATSPIIGREAELEEITSLFNSVESRLVSLVGPGGIGKTRLATEAANSLRRTVAGDAHFISFAAIPSPDLIAATILDATAAQANRKGDHLAQLCSYLEYREVLLVLDNFEHLLEGALVLKQLLDAAPGLRLLVTSRQRLALTGETVVDVTGLSLPEAPDVPSLARAGSTRLFMLRARKHKSSFLPREEDAPAIARIAHLTGGMPLAIELAAAWVPVLPPEEIASEIERSLDFLATEIRDLPERHRSVRAVVDRSWENLSEVEQRIFRRLSVFIGGFDRNAANYVTGASLPVLSALVSKSLIRLNEQGRYEIHELLRQHAAERLSMLPRERDMVHDRFRDHFIGFVAVREEQLKSRAQATVLSEIGAEFDNIRAAWWRSIETEDIPGMARSVHSLWLYFDITDRYTEGKSLLRAGRKALQGMKEFPREIEYERALAIARLLSREAALDFRLKGHSQFQQQLDVALAWLEELDEPAEEGLLFNFLACASHAASAHDEEEAYLQKSLELFERAGDEWGLAYSRNDKGQLRTLQGRFEEARDLHRKALAFLEGSGDQRGIAFALRNLGIAESHLGNTERAIAFLHRSVEIRRPIGNQWGMAESLKQIGVILRDSGYHAEARARFHEALHIARDIRAMQLASEIISDYLPILQSSEFSNVGELPFEDVSESPARRYGDLDVSAVTELADVLLDRNTDVPLARTDGIREMRSGCVP